MKFYFYRYFWWLAFPWYWWKSWRYSPSKEIPFKPGEMNFVQGWNDNPRYYFTVFYKSDEPPYTAMFNVAGEPIDRVWCAGLPPKRPSRPMPKGTVAYA